MAIQKISELVLLPSQVTEQTKQLPATLTPKQMHLQRGVKREDFLKEWKDTAVVNTMPTALTDIAAMAEQSVTLADVKAVWGFENAMLIVFEQLKGLFYFSESKNEDADKKRKCSQLLDTAGLIVDEFYFLTLPEFCCYIRRVQTGMYGQISWGSNGINTQQLFCTMREFQRDRKTAYDKLEAAKQQAESLERRNAGYVGAVQNGIAGHYAKCHEDFEYFCKAFPILDGSPHAKNWWEHFKKDQEKAIRDIWNLTTTK